MMTSQEDNTEVRTSIKEVTSAIVHYVSGLRKPEEESEPRGGKMCWMESSFVGAAKGADDGGDKEVPPATSLRLHLQTHNGESVHV